MSIQCPACGYDIVFPDPADHTRVQCWRCRHSFIRRGSVKAFPNSPTGSAVSPRTKENKKNASGLNSLGTSHGQDTPN